MRTQIGFGILAVCLVAGMVTMDSAKLAGEDQKPQSTIRAEDIGLTVKVLGRLGCPLHEVMAVRGTWVESEADVSKPGTTLWFRVSQVNGKQLDRPVEFSQYDITVAEKLEVEAIPAKGEQWELRAYETWPVRDHPPEYWKELGVAQPAPPPHGATRMFGVLKQRTAK
jgi:hypothetical protein